MKKIKYWCDSGANHQSCRTGTITLDELGFTEDEWHELTDKQHEDIMRDIALENLDWGYSLED